jgi:hypothetical protein
MPPEINLDEDKDEDEDEEGRKEEEEQDPKPTTRLKQNITTNAWVMKFCNTSDKDL